MMLVNIGRICGVNECDEAIVPNQYHTARVVWISNDKKVFFKVKVSLNYLYIFILDFDKYWVCLT